jgi:chitinase
VSNQTTATVSGLDPDRNYSFAVAAYNTSGMEGPYSNVVTALEAVPPVVSISNPGNNAKVSNTVDVMASASDNVGVVKVEYYVNGTLKGTDDAEPYLFSWDTLAVTPGVYSISAKAYDAVGNVGDSTVTVSVVNDVTSPTIFHTAPVQGSRVSGTINVSCNASDDVGVSRVEFFVNGAMRAAVNYTPYYFSWDTKAVADGSYILSAKAYDAAGNVGQAATVTVTVNNTVPVLDKIAPTVTAFRMPSSANSLTAAVSSLTASDSVGVTGYLITESVTKPAASAAGWTASAPKSFTLSGTGRKTIYAWAKDAAGNISASRSATITITLPDTTAPTVTISAPANNATVSGTVSAIALANDKIGVSRVEFYVNNVLKVTDTRAPYTFSWNTTAVANGPYTLTAKAYDAAGNIGKSSNLSVTVKNTARTTARTTTTYTSAVRR